MFEFVKNKKNNKFKIWEVNHTRKTEKFEKFKGHCQLPVLNNGITEMVNTSVLLIHAWAEREREATLLCVLDEGAASLSADPRTSLGAPEWVCIT